MVCCAMCKVIAADYRERERDFGGLDGGWRIPRDCSGYMSAEASKMKITIVF